MPSTKAWQPSRFVRLERVIATSAETARIITDAGPAYLKAMGNRGGEHILACELVGTQLADWFELPTLDWALMELKADDEIPLRNGLAKPGPAFVTRAVPYVQWGGSANELRRVVNLDIIPRLIAFDTWTLNYDRHPPKGIQRQANYDNVFLIDEGRDRLKLLCADHTHCFVSGSDLTGKVATIDRITDEGVFGLFPAFCDHIRRNAILAAARHLAEFNEHTATRFVGQIPNQWSVSDKARSALAELICGRARFLADNIVRMLEPYCFSDDLFDDSGEAMT